MKYDLKLDLIFYQRDSINEYNIVKFKMVCAIDFEKMNLIVDFSGYTVGLVYV